MHQDLTPSVMAGLAWYYLLAAMLNAAAAAYVAYMEMVSEGASRRGPGPQDPAPARLADRSPSSDSTAWPCSIILGRHVLPGASRVAYCLCALANALLAITAGADAAHFAEVRESGPVMARARRLPHPASTTTSPPSGLGKPINRTLWTLIWSVAAVVFQAMGITYHVRRRDHSCRSSSATPIDYVPARPRSSSVRRSASSP